MRFCYFNKLIFLHYGNVAGKWQNALLLVNCLKLMVILLPRCGELFSTDLKTMIWNKV